MGMLTLGLMVAGAGCGGDDKSDAQKAAERLAADAGVDPETLRDAEDLLDRAEEQLDEKNKGLPKPCELLTESLVKETFESDVENTSDSSLGCTYDLTGTPNFVADGTKPVVPPSLSFRMEQYSQAAWDQTKNMFSAEAIEGGAGKEAVYSTIGGAIYRFITEDDVLMELQLVTIGSTPGVDDGDIQSTLDSLAKTLESTL